MKRTPIIVTVIGLVAVSGLSAREISRIGINQGYSPSQPIAFSHKLHAGDNQIPCLYCHSAARTSRHAGIPSPSVCMNCHGMLEKQTPEIEKLKEAVQERRAISWVKVHNLPDFAYFNHSQHVVSGVACQACHGSVERMDRVRQDSPLTMGWCLDCHRARTHLPVNSVQRAALGLLHRPTPTSNLDCTSCHY